jgi:hypothetical protein
MDKAGEGTQVARRPAAPAEGQRPGQSGEGARSALEQLIQQERRRDAQLPREGGTPPNPRRAP